jgi:hypothetical protein
LRWSLWACAASCDSIHFSFRNKHLHNRCTRH